MTLDGLLAFLASLFSPAKASSPPVRSWTAQDIKNLVYAAPPLGMAPDYVFALFALEIGIESWAWTPGETFLATRSLSNRHVGTGRGFWTKEKLLVVHDDGRAPEELRVYSSPEQSLQDFGQLMADPLYRQASSRAINRDRKGFFQGVTDAGYDKPDYKDRLEARYQTLKARGVI